MNRQSTILNDYNRNRLNLNKKISTKNNSMIQITLEHDKHENNDYYLVRRKSRNNNNNNNNRKRMFMTGKKLAKLKPKRRRNMLRIIENWPSLRSLANMDLQSLVRSLRSQDKKSIQNMRADCHAERPPRLDRLLEQEELPEDIQVENGWSLERKSPNVNILQNGLIGKRRPIAKSTDCMFGRMGYTKGLHVWTIQWPVECRGTHAVVGVATESMQYLHTSGYCSLVGSDCESYGWDIVRSRFFHNKKETTYPIWLGSSSHDKFQIPDEFTVVLDMDEGTLGFIVDGLYLGVAYTGLSGKKLYPVISTVWGNVEIGIHYTGYMPPGPLLLRECCRKTIRQHSGKKRIRKLVQETRIPLVLKEYLLN